MTWMSALEWIKLKVGIEEGEVVAVFQVEIKVEPGVRSCNGLVDRGKPQCLQ